MLIDVLLGILRRLPYGPRHAILRRLASRGLDRALARRRHSIYRHENRRIGVDPGDHVGREMLKYGWYEDPYVRFVRAYLADPDGTFMDIGANAGNYSLALAPCYAHTLAFEPNPAVYPTLAANLGRNPDLRVTAVSKGLSSRAGRLAFYPNHAANSGASGFNKKRDGVTPEMLEVARGDDYTGDVPPVAAIKIDVEGHELDVLRGLADTLRRSRPYVFLEWLTHTMEAHGGIEALKALLPEYCLLASDTPHRVTLAPISTPYRSKYNILFCLPAEKLDALARTAPITLSD